MIALDSVRYAYPGASAYVLYDLTLHVPAGSLTGIVGAAGAGKTTLAKVLAGFIPATEGGTFSGHAQVGGSDVTAAPLHETCQRVGLVTQNPFNQISGAKYTVRDELAFGLENLGIAREQMRERIAEVAALLRLEGLLERSPYQISGGQQQLVAIASILVMRPAVLVLDEPTSQLDPAGTRLVFETLGALREEGRTIVVFEHKLAQLREVADAACVLAGGRIQLAGRPREVLSSPLLPQWGIAPSQYTSAARAISPGDDSGQPPTGEQTLPVSLADAVGYFGPGESR